MHLNQQTGWYLYFERNFFLFLFHFMNLLSFFPLSQCFSSNCSSKSVIVLWYFLLFVDFIVLCFAFLEIFIFLFLRDSMCLYIYIKTYRFFIHFLSEICNLYTKGYFLEKINGFNTYFYNVFLFLSNVFKNLLWFYQLLE